MKTYRLLALAVTIVSLTSFADVWKGVNLKFLTDAYQDLVKGYPCVVETKNYELKTKFDEFSKGELLQSKVVSYDENGYIDFSQDKDKTIRYKNEYSGGKIIKRTALIDDRVSEVIEYSYSSNGVIVAEYNSKGRLNDRLLFRIVDGRLCKISEDGTMTIIGVR